ncbi:MAG: acetate--CoA ligase family protein [Rhodobacteraceae bacterium]|nr:acetate--CoA ligase family protein [Paracoccaceae bacterium]
MSVRETLENWVRQGRQVVHEADAKALLSEIGVPVPERDPADGKVVVKLCHDDFPHKSDHGLVRLGLTPADAPNAAAEMVARVPGGVPLIEAMEQNAQVEWIVGCKIDATFGPIVLAGPGGVLVELLDAGEIRLAPATTETALDMLGQGAGARLLDGMRGAPAADRAALADLISRISVFFAQNADLISEIEVNPVMVRADGRGLVAADALIVLHDAAQT